MRYGKYFFISLFVVVVPAVIVYYIFWTALVTSPGLETLSSGDWKALARAYNSGFLWVVIVLALSAGVGSIFLFHRLLGPISVFEKAIDILKAGDFRVSIHSRRKDELRGMAIELQTMIDNVRKAARQDREKLAEIKKKMDSGNYEGAKELLSKVNTWYTLD
jgi:methyl-accepting chemotaxis protein